jgi:hypothetical protein
MPNKFYDLSLHPAFRHGESSVPINKHIAIGDLHGNPIKLVHLLLDEGVLELSNDEYDNLYNAYVGFDGSPKKQIEAFLAALENVTLKSNPAKITLIGDELADRGVNDYLMLKTIGKIFNLSKDKNGVKNFDFEILVSNHGYEFASSYMLAKKSSFKNDYGKQSLFEHDKYDRSVNPCDSLDSFINLIKKKIITFEEAKSTIECSGYFESLTAISYSDTIDENGKEKTTVFTHAPVTMFEIKKTAENLGVKNLECLGSPSKQQFKDVVDRINVEFKRKLCESNLSKTKFCDILFSVIWNRYSDFQDLKQNFNKANYFPDTYSWVHGHDVQEVHVIAELGIEGYPIVCLDDDLGYGRVPGKDSWWQDYGNVYCETKPAFVSNRVSDQQDDAVCRISHSPLSPSSSDDTLEDSKLPAFRPVTFSSALASSDSVDMPAPTAARTASPDLKRQTDGLSQLGGRKSLEALLQRLEHLTSDEPDIDIGTVQKPNPEEIRTLDSPAAHHHLLSLLKSKQGNESKTNSCMMEGSADSKCKSMPGLT